jgi:hypothetical protein
MQNCRVGAVQAAQALREREDSYKGRPLTRWDPCQQSPLTARTRPSAVTLCPANSTLSHAASHTSLNEPPAQIIPDQTQSQKRPEAWQDHWGLRLHDTT